MARARELPSAIASVSSMFAVMINSSNRIVRILNTMGREELLPRLFALIGRHRKLELAGGLLAAGEVG